MEDLARNAWEEALIVDIRENDGRPTKGPLAGHPLAVMHMTGAKTGRPRRAIVTLSRQGDDFVIAATDSGARTDPAWVANLRARPDVRLEIGKRIVKVRAHPAEGAERDQLWQEHVAQLPWFAKYPEQAQRTIPVFRLTPRE